MGNEAEVTIEKETPEDVIEALAEEESAISAEETETARREELEAEGKTEEEIEALLQDEAEEGEELEIVREVTQPQKFTQQQVDDIVSKRVKRLNKKNDATGEAATTANTELALEKERTKLLTIALEQAKGSSEAPKQPNPEDFDDGVSDPKYQEQLKKFNESVIAAEVTRQVTEAQSHSDNVVSLNAQNEQLQKKQRNHYERATELGVKDYETTEDAALEVLGNEYANHLIDNFDDSHIIMYYLGKHPDEAKNISNLLKTNPIKGVAELGRLSSELKVTPKSVAPAPDPDEEIKGDLKPDSSAVQKKLDKLREQAAATGNIKPLIEFKRKHNL